MELPPIISEALLVLAITCHRMPRTVAERDAKPMCQVHYEILQRKLNSMIHLLQWYPPDPVTRTDQLEASILGRH